MIDYFYKMNAQQVVHQCRNRKLNNVENPLKFPRFDLGDGSNENVLSAMKIEEHTEY